MDWQVRRKVYGHALRNKIGRWLGRSIDPYPARPEGTALSPSLGLAVLTREAARRHAFDPADMAGWQSAARATLAAMTGYRPAEGAPTLTATRSPFEMPVTGAGSGTGSATRTTYYLRVRPETDVPVTLIAPAGLAAPAPVFLHLAGSTSGVHLGWGEAKVPIDHQRLSIGADMARQAAGRGYLAVCIEQSGYGEMGERDLAKRSSTRTLDAATHAVLLGRTLQGLRAMDISAALDWLLGPAAPHPVDPERVFLFGHSSGGTTAQFAAALEPRIRGVLASGSVRRIAEIVTTRGSGSGEHLIPGFLDAFETDDLIALTAPRPFVGLSGTRDHIFPFEGVARAVDGARAAYAALGADSRLAAVEAPAGHRYYAAESWAAWEKFIDPPRR